MGHAHKLNRTCCISAVIMLLMVSSPQHVQ